MIHGIVVIIIPCKIGTEFNYSKQHYKLKCLIFSTWNIAWEYFKYDSFVFELKQVTYVVYNVYKTI